MNKTFYTTFRRASEKIYKFCGKHGENIIECVADYDDFCADCALNEGREHKCLGYLFEIDALQILAGWIWPASIHYLDGAHKLTLEYNNVTRQKKARSYLQELKVLNITQEENRDLIEGQENVPNVTVLYA